MKTINVTFTDEEHKRLESHKNFLMLGWHDYIIACGDYARALNFTPREGEFVRQVDEEKESK